MVVMLLCRPVAHTVLRFFGFWSRALSFHHVAFLGSAHSSDTCGLCLLKVFWIKSYFIHSLLSLKEGRCVPAKRLI